MLKMKTKPSAEQSAAIVLLLGQILAAGSAFVVNLLAARVLNPTDRGDLAFALQLAYFATVFVVMGLERPLMAAREGTFNDEMRVFVRLTLPGTLVLLPIILIVTSFSPLSEKWFWLGALFIAGYVALNSLTRGVRVAYVASKNWKRFSFNAIGSQLLIMGGAVVLVSLDISSPVHWMLVYFLSTLPAVVLLVISLLKRNTSSKLPKHKRRELRRRGWVLLPSEFSNTAMLRSDRLFLPVLGSSADLGLYVTVATVLEMSAWPVKQWVDASLRRWSKSQDTLRDRVPGLLIRSFLLLVGTSALLGVAAYVMIRLFLPPAYMAAAPVILPLGIASVIYGITRVQQGILISFGAAGRVSVVDMVGTVVSIAAYVALIPGFGMLGAAYGSIIGYLACYLAGAFVLRSVQKGN